METTKRLNRWVRTGKLTIQLHSCWIWQGCLNSDGYPKVSDKGNVNGKGHRVMYKFCNPEEDITGKVIRHTCDNKVCMNPSHLISGSPTENMTDRHERGRTYNQISVDEINSVKNLNKRGFPQSIISERTGIEYRRVEYILKKYVRSVN